MKTHAGEKVKAYFEETGMSVSEFARREMKLCENCGKNVWNYSASLKNCVFLLSELFDIKPTKIAKNNAIFN